MKKLAQEILLIEGDEPVTITTAKGVITIDSDGVARVDAGNHGFVRNLFDDTVISDLMLGAERYQPSKAEKIRDYLYMLFESQKSGHDVHIEIKDELKQYKAELGI